LELADPDKIYSLHSERYDVEMPDDLNGKIEPFKKNAPFDTLTEARDKHPEQVARDVELYKIGAVNSLIKAETNQNKSRWGVPSRYYPNYDPINKEIACRTR
jgi:hypothetical protein